MALFGKQSFTIAAVVLGPAILGAQAPAKPACDVAESAKGTAARATLMVSMAREATTPAVAMTNLKSAVKLVEKTDRGDDATVNAYVLGSALSLWANQPGIGLKPARGTLGFSTNPDAPIDIPITIDSLFRIVEAARPVCSDFTAYWRAGQKFYLDVVNGAINSLNADKLDSAEYFARQANTLYAGAPYGFMVLGTVAQKRNDNAKALEYWGKAAEIAGRDSSYRDVRRQMLANMGGVYLTTASTATGAEKTEAARKAADVYTQLIAIPGTRGSFATNGRQNLQTALLLAGDTAAAAKTWAPLIANPSQYDYLDLLNSAVNATRANRVDDASRLFEATLSQNPYSRDALYNVAVTYLTLEQYDKVGPIVTRLVDVDPANPENYNLAARAFLAKAKVADKAKNTKVAAAYNDTTVTWYNQGNKLPVEVTFREFSASDKQVVIAGTVTDRRDKSDANEPQPAAPAPAKAAKGAKGKAAPAPKTPQPKIYPATSYTLTFQGLDKAGGVVGTQTVKTDPLTPGQSFKFSIAIPGAGILAHRYKIGE